MIFYAYMWLRYDGTPYYVGKGRDRRAFRKLSHIPNPPSTCDRIIIEYFPNEEDALFAEKFLIAYWGRKDIGTGILRNLTDGGEAPNGLRHSFDTRRKMSLSQKGLKRSPRTQSHIDNLRVFSIGNKWCVGRKLSAETRRKIGDGNQGKVLSSEARQKVSAFQKGRPKSDAWKTKVRAAWTPERRLLQAQRTAQMNRERYS